MSKPLDWNRLSKKYLKKVKAIYQESDDLKEILKIQLQQQATDSLEQIAGIKTDFDLVEYQATILEKYGNLKLESLDSSGYIYDKELKIYQIFIPQNVKECQEYLPKVYELPKELQRQLKEKGELDSTLLILKQFAQSGAGGEVRSNAVYQLTSVWHDDPDLFEFLVNCAVSDPFVRDDNWRANPRKTALEEIIKYFPNHLHTKDLLVNRSQNDPDERVRKFAQQALAKLSE